MRPWLVPSNLSGSVRLLDTIVAGNAATDSSPDLNGSFISDGFNLIGNIQGATGLSINDFQNVPANLGPLRDNGGSTPTCAPLPGSFAIDYGTSAGAPTVDQRGVPRPQNSVFDIGAVEFVSTPLLTGPLGLGTSGFSLSTILDTTNSYRIRGSTNLTTWVDLTNFQSGGRFVADVSRKCCGRRFYRAVAP